MVHSVCIIVAQRVNNPLDTIMISIGERGSNIGLELKGSGFAFVIELVLEQA